MSKAETKAAQLNFTALLERLTDKKGWLEIGRPDSGTGFDHWFASGTSEAHINRNKKWLTVTVDSEMFFEGSVQEASAI